MTVNVAAWPGGFARELCVFVVRSFTPIPADWGVNSPLGRHREQRAGGGDAGIVAGGGCVVLRLYIVEPFGNGSRQVGSGDGRAAFGTGSGCGSIGVLSGQG